MFLLTDEQLEKIRAKAEAEEPRIGGASFGWNKETGEFEISYAVTVLQRHLSITADGNFGAGTKAKLIEYQKAHGLTADGICGPGTWGSFT